VKLYYSPARQVIAVEPANPRIGAPFPLNTRAHGGVMINAQRMLRHHRIVIDGPEVFIHPEIGNDGILLLDLHQTTRTGGWTAARRSRESKTGSDDDELNHPGLPATPPYPGRASKRGQIAKLSREEKRERRALERARETEAKMRERKAQQRRREVTQKNAAELSRRTDAIAAARKNSKERLAAFQVPKENYRSAGF
jgi:hypothetical protein